MEGDQEQEFLVGVATSGYQSEGGYNGPGEPQNNWSEYEATGRVARTGEAAGFWTRYREDFALCRGIGLNAFRLSIEWARVQPSHTAGTGRAPEFDFEAIDAYADRIAACREAGLEPVVTLHHFTHPAWLGSDAWLDDETPGQFEKFVSTTVARVNHRLTARHGQRPAGWYVTINEPNMLVLNTYMGRHFPGSRQGGIPTGVRAYNRLLSAHIRAYNAIHDLYETERWLAPRVSMNTFCSDVYWSEHLLFDLLSLRGSGVPASGARDYFLSRENDFRRALAPCREGCRKDLLAGAGRLVHRLADFYARRAATADGFSYFFTEAGRSKRDRVMDFLGLDYYDPFFAHLFRPPTFSDLEFSGGSLPGRLMDGLSSKWWDWHVAPEALHTFCRHYAGAFPGTGILIAENGMALRSKVCSPASGGRRDRVLRSEFLAAHLRQVRRILDDGIPLHGYLHWSLTDNYEWGSFTPRFGLFRIDYANGLARQAEDHLGDNPSATYARLIRELGLAGQPAQ